MQTKTAKRHASSIFFKDDAAQTANPIDRAMDKKAVEMFAAPIEGTLKNFVEFGHSSVAGHEQTPPHQWTHATKHVRIVRFRRPGVPFGQRSENCRILRFGCCGPFHRTDRLLRDPVLYILLNG